MAGGRWLFDLRQVLPQAVLVEVAERIYGSGFVGAVMLPAAVSLCDRSLLSLLRALRRAVRQRAAVEASTKASTAKTSTTKASTEAPDGAAVGFLLRAIAVQVLQSQVAVVEFTQPAATATLTFSAPQALALHAYVQEHLARAITIAELARHLGMSRMTFLRRFKATTAVTVGTWINEVRVERARALLAHEDVMSMAEIAARCGFSGASHLSSSLRSRLKSTPFVYRAQRLARQRAPELAADAKSGTERLLLPVRRAATDRPAPVAPGFTLAQTSLIVSDRVRLLASSESLGWTDLFAAITDELPHANTFRAIPAVWLAKAFSPLAIQRANRGSVREHAVMEHTVSITGAGDAAHDEIFAPVRALHIYLRQSLIDEVGEELFSGDGARDIRTEFGLTDPTLQRMLMVAERALGEPAFGNQLKVDYLSHALAAHLLTHYSSYGARRGLIQMASAFDGNETRRLTDYITEHLASDLRIAELADVLGMTRTYFITRFQATTNVTPHQFVLLRRVGSARRLLADPRLTTTDIAQRCGFANVRHFSTLFKRFTGLTPGDYRRVLGGGG